MFGGLSNELIDLPNDFGKKSLVANALQTVCVACGAAVTVVDVDQVDVTGYVQLARP